jgi:hypothetical protein
VDSKSVRLSPTMIAGALAAVLLMLLPLRLPAQVDSASQHTASDTASPTTVNIVPGPRYRAGWVHRLFLGSHYRDLWTTPVPAEVLDLDTFAGGLRPSKRGGGTQTKSLRFRGADGREYVVRSVEKDPSPNLPPELRGTAVAELVHDQISAGHPVAPLVVAPLLEATGVLYTQPRLVVLRKDDPRLGEFKAEFGGMLGILEERPEDSNEGTGFKGAVDVISSEQLLKRLERGPDDEVDAKAFLSARLVDVFLGDWDRHRDQWRWARFGDTKPRRWVAIPRDRDQAFARFDGFLLTVARANAPQLVKFGPRYPGMLGLTWNGRDLDRRLLVGLERPVWDAIAADLQSRLTDQVIENAVSRLPVTYHPIDSTRLARALKGRRDRLREAAHKYYEHLAGEVEVHTTDVDENLIVDRVDAGHTEVSVARRSADGSQGEPFFRRRFDRKDTKEVRLFPHGGDDHVVVRGNTGGVRVRVIAGGGHDEVADSSRGGPLTLYATDPDDRVLPGRSVKVSRRPYHPKDPAIRDWGHRWLSQMWISGGPDVGLFVGSGVSLTHFGFRQDPFANRWVLRAGYATGASTGRAELIGERHWPNSRLKANLLARASGIEVLRFHGFGNETSDVGSSEFFRVKQADFLVKPSLTIPLGERLDFTLGPLLRYSSTDFDPNRFISIARPYGSGEFGMVGGAGEFQLDLRDRRVAATRGVLFTAGGSFYPGVWNVEEAFGELHGEAATYLTARSAPLQPTLALRAGGKRVWGRFPYQEAAYIGGNSTVRLGREHRYAGDAAVYAGAELRLFLTKFYLFVPGDFGIFGLGDVGRVYLEGESSDVWHAAAGGGIWASFLSRANTVSLALARSAERTGLYFGVGFGF